MLLENGQQEIATLINYNQLKSNLLLIELNNLTEKKIDLEQQIIKHKEVIKQFLKQKSNFKKNLYTFVIANGLSKLSLVKNLQLKRQEKLVELQSLVSELEDELAKLETAIENTTIKINKIKNRIEKLKYISEMEDL